MNSSIIRDGNHFIRIDDVWVLIDGPWFDRLEAIYQRTSFKCVVWSALVSIKADWHDEPSLESIIRNFTWERVQLRNGRVLLILDGLLHAKEKTAVMYEFLYNPSRLLDTPLARHRFTGWRLKDSGKLPAFYEVAD